MATVVATTPWNVAKNTATDTITLSQAATAGNTLVLWSIGGANVTAAKTNLNNSMTQRATQTSSLGQSIYDIVATGGETSLTLTLGGAENMAGIVYELNAGSGSLTFLSSATNTAGTALSNALDRIVSTAAVTLASGNGLIVSGFGQTGTLATAPFNNFNQFHGLGPAGNTYVNAGEQPGANAQFLYTGGLADVTSSGSYPATQSAGSFQASSQYLGATSAGGSYAVCALYQDTSGVATNPAVNAVTAENSLPGTMNANWQLIYTSSLDSTIAGYTDKTSYQPGDTVNFKVDSTSNPFRVEIYRLGFYGFETVAARNVLGNSSGYLTGTVVAQSAPTVDGTLGSTSCAWTTNATWTVPSNATPGFYYVLYRRTDVTTHVSVGHFIVRSANATGKIAVIIPDTTYQAYNTWGATTDSNGVTTGRNLYGLNADGNFAHRAYAVCFDRPYATWNRQRNTYFFDAEMSSVVFMEAQGYNLTYFSCIDLENNTTLLNDASLVILLGHQEYWTTNIYNCVTNAVQAGVNMMVVGGNTALWHTRFAVADTNKRTMICYKDSTTQDVTAGWTGTGFDPVSYTGTWRDTRTNAGTVNNTDIRRENALTGQLFNVNAWASAPAFQVPFAQKTLPIWRNSPAVQALTSGTSYTQPVAQGGNLGPEFDLADGSSGQPANLVQLNPVSTTFTGICANANGTIYSSTVTANMGFSLYRRNSGALILHTGSWRGWQGISRWAAGTISNPITTPDVNWQNAFLAAMYDLGQKPTAIVALEADTVPTNPATGAPGTNRNVIASAYGLTVPAPSLML